MTMTKRMIFYQLSTLNYLLNHSSSWRLRKTRTRETARGTSMTQPMIRLADSGAWVCAAGVESVSGKGAATGV